MLWKRKLPSLCLHPRWLCGLICFSGVMAALLELGLGNLDRGSGKHTCYGGRHAGGSQSSLEHSVPQLKPLFYFGRILSTLILAMTQQFGKTKKDDTVQVLRWAHYFTQLTFHSDLLFLASSWSSAGFVFFSGAAVPLNLSKWWCFLFCWDCSCVPDCTASKSTGDHVSSPSVVF